MIALSRGGIAASFVVVLTIATAVVLVESQSEVSQGCRDVSSTDLAAIRLLLPRDWTVQHAVYTTSATRTRNHDGAPVSFVAASIWRADGTPAEAEPGLWMIEGGIGSENERNPRGYFVYNDEAARITDAGYSLDEQGKIVGGRRRIQDARVRKVNPIPAGETEAVEALRCLAERVTDR